MCPWSKGNMLDSQLTRQNSGVRRVRIMVSDPTTIVVRTDSGYKSVVPGGYKCNWTPMVTQPILCSLNRGRRNCEGVTKSP
ncbi:hypothetical protein GIB67_014419, partial [Kingdonia uniflora]